MLCLLDIRKVKETVKEENRTNALNQTQKSLKYRGIVIWNNSNTKI